MKFRLVYSGQLLGASRSDPRSEHKHEIRKAFNGQLATLWKRSPNLSNWGSWEFDNNRSMRERLASSFMIEGAQYIPLSFDNLGVACSLDILMLRPELPGQTLIKGGDIDNRLKTLFDALRIPHKGEVGEPEGSEPFYCLLQDDKLINRISVDTDILLEEVETNHVELIVTVDMWPIVHNSYNMGIF